MVAGLFASCENKATNTVDVPVVPDIRVMTNDVVAADVSADVHLVQGCPLIPDPVAAPGDDIGGDTYANFGSTFFTTWCVRCHSSTLGPGQRNDAPLEYNWDVEATVRANLGRIRTAVATTNFMPLNAPFPSCDERRRFARWLDAAAP